MLGGIVARNDWSVGRRPLVVPADRSRMEGDERRFVMLALVTYGSKMGGTQGLAEMVADSFRTEGFEAEVRPAREVDDVSRYDVIVVGGALYAFRGHRDARRFV